jgi:hypothetical protein
VETGSLSQRKILTESPMNAPVPVFLPRDRDLLIRGTVDVQETTFMFSSSLNGLKLTVRSDAFTLLPGSSLS